MIVKNLDCTLRDGGYYNNWDYDVKFIKEYLIAMEAINIDFVELGLRTLSEKGYKGSCAYTSDEFIEHLDIPYSLNKKIGVMINGAELLSKVKQEQSSGKEKDQDMYLKLEKLFPTNKYVSLVRVACHAHEFIECLPAATWLQKKGFKVGFNLMQIADKSKNEINELVKTAKSYPIDVLYFADSLGGLNNSDVEGIINAFRQEWDGPIGIHTHDNMGQAVSNTFAAIENGVTWVDSTVTGMGRGPGNAQTEYLILAMEKYGKSPGNPTKLFELVRKKFKPMQSIFGWGTNPYYYLAGKHGIHPTYIQEMLQDPRYCDEDIIAVIDHLKINGGKSFNLNTLEGARNFFQGSPVGSWIPKDFLSKKDILIIGSGPGTEKYKLEIETFIRKVNPYVLSLNIQNIINENLIDAHIASHPVRLLADCNEHLKFEKPLIAPLSMMPDDLKKRFSNKQVLDFGISIKKGTFEFYNSHAEVPSSLVIAYALAIASSAKVKNIFLAGFDGYPSDDMRFKEMEDLISIYCNKQKETKLTSITPTSYSIKTKSVYGFNY